MTLQMNHNIVNKLLSPFLVTKWINKQRKIIKLKEGKQND